MSQLKSRTRIYGILAGVPLLLAAVFLGTMSGSDRSAFLSDYGNTIGRMVDGDWELSELTEPERRVGVGRMPMSYGRRSTSQVFGKLDRNQDNELDQDEVGKRLTASLGQRAGSQFSLSLNEFQKKAIAGSMPNDNILPPFSPDEAPPLTVEELFDSTKVIHVEVKIAAEDWKVLCSQRRNPQEAFENPIAKPYTYFKGDISVNGHEIKDVGIRTKGFLGSPDNIRPGLKIKFDEYVDQQPIEGLDRLTLNNNKQDRALVSQFLTYKLFRDAGIPAPRVAFAAVTVNGKYLGVYSHVESIRKPFLRHAFGNDEGNLYEGTLSDFYPKSIEWFERKTNKSKDDRSQLLALSNVLDLENPTTQEISRHVELGAFLRFWAIESLIHFWDGYTQNQNNFYVYENPADGLSYFVPWGADSCFSESGRSRHSRSSSVSVRATSILANRLYHIEGVPNEYRTAMLDVFGEAWDESSLLAEMDRITDLLFDYIDFNQVESLLAMDDIRDFIMHRRERVMAELDDEVWPIEVASGPRIPMHELQVGEASGSYSSSVSAYDDENETESASNVDARLTLGEQTESFTSAAVEGGEKFVAGATSTLSVSLSMDYEGDDLALTLKTTSELSDLAPGRYEGNGILTDWSRVRRGRDIRGELTIESVDVANDRIEGEFSVKLFEKRGGHMDRRR